MSTRSSARNLFPPLDNPELTIRRTSHSDPTLLNNSKMAAEGNGDLPVPDLRTMDELCQPSLNGRGGPIALIAIQGDDANKHLDKFLHVTQSIKVNGVTDDALRLYLFPHSLTHHATAWFDRLLRNSIYTFEQMATMFLGKYFPPSMVTKLINEITNFRQRPDESLFETWERYKLSIDRCSNHNMLPVTQIDTFYNGLTLGHRDTINAAAGGTFMKRRLDECYDLIENMIAHHNDWDTSAQRITPNCETCGGPHSFSDCPATVGNTQNVYVAGAYQGNSDQPQGNSNLLSYRSDNYLGPPGNIQGRNQFFQGANQGQNQPQAYQAPAYQALVYQAPVHQPQIPQPQVVTTNEFTNFMKANNAILKNMQTNMTSLTNSNFELKNMLGQFMKMNTASSLGSSTLPGNTITNPKEDMKGITTRSATAYSGPTIPTCSSSLVVECETEETKDIVHPTNNGSTEDVQPPVVPAESSILTSEPVISLIIEHVASPVSASRPNQRPSIPYPSRLQDQKLRDKANDQREKFFQIFKDLNFNISFVDALILMPKFGPSIKSLLKAFLNDDPSLPPPNQGNYLPEVRKELKICEAKSDKSSIDEPSEVELKDLPPHLEYTFLEGDDKLPIIIAKDLSVEEKIALITVLKSHKRAIAWKLSDIKGIDPEFCTHKILMKEDFEPAAQHQRRVNPKIHDVIKQEEKSHFMVKKGIVLGHKISKEGIKVDKAKVDVITKLPHPTTVKGIQSFLGHAGFYQRFIKDFLKIAMPMTHLLEKDTPFIFSKECVESFQTLKRKLTEAPILIAPDWDMPFELIKTMTEAESNYTTTEKEMLAVVYAFKKFRSYLIMKKSIVYTNHSALKYLFAKKDSKERLLLGLYSSKSSHSK
nr:hypothetical protein [Tanacetum cinerariifolium]